MSTRHDKSSQIISRLSRRIHDRRRMDNCDHLLSGPMEECVQYVHEFEVIRSYRISRWDFGVSWFVVLGDQGKPGVPVGSIDVFYRSIGI